MSNVSNMFRVSCESEVFMVSQEEALDVADRLFNKYGKQPLVERAIGEDFGPKCGHSHCSQNYIDTGDTSCVPLLATVVDADDVPATERAPSSFPPAIVDAVGFSTWGATVVDDSAKERIERLHAALADAGVKVNAGQQYFATGTRMASEGYATQDKRKAEHDALLPMRHVAEALAASIDGEHRVDVEMSTLDIERNIAVTERGFELNGRVLREQAIKGLASLMRSPMLGYYGGVQSRIGDSASVAFNRSDLAFLAEVIRHECRRNDRKVVLRTRNSGIDDVFAIVSPGYVACDANQILPDILKGMPADARGSWAYDAESTQWEVRAQVWTPTPVQEHAVGEPFQGFVSFRSRDNGTSKCRGEGGAMMLRCLNASTYLSEGTTAERMHRGKILFDIRAMIEAATRAVDVLVDAWGMARNKIVEVPQGTPIEEAIPGFWRHLLTSKSSELQGVLVGRVEDNVSKLTDAFYGERRNRSELTVSDFGQGWTKHIQSLPAEQRRDAESAAGAFIVNGSAPRYMPAR